jgi:hypothetical protein
MAPKKDSKRLNRAVEILGSDELNS